MRNKIRPLMPPKGPRSNRYIRPISDWYSRGSMDFDRISSIKDAEGRYPSFFGRSGDRLGARQATLPAHPTEDGKKFKVMAADTFPKSTAIDLMGTQQEIDVIIGLSQRLEGVEDVSEPSVLDASRALNAGLTPEMVEQVLQVITMVFSTGTAALQFLKELRAELKARGGVVAVSEPASGKPLGRVEGGTADEALADLTPP